MKSDPTFPTQREVASMTADVIVFRNGGARPIRRLESLEWEICLQRSDPLACASALITAFVAKNRIGFGILGNLIWKQCHEGEPEEELFKYVPRRNGAAARERWCRPAAYQDGEVLSQCAEGRKAIPERLIVVVSRVLGVPEALILERASTAAETNRLHLSRRALAIPVTDEERLIYERIAPIVNALPLRHKLSPSEALELYRQMQAIT